MVPGLASKLPPIVNGESLYYWSVHRNKKRLAIDLKHPEGREIAHRFVETSDALLENFRPGVMKRLGLSYAEVHKINSALVYCSISGYGHDNSWSDRPAHDLNLIAESGVLDFTRAPDGRPVLPGALVSDYMAGMYGALAVVSALLSRVKSGKGKHIDISMFEAAISTQQIMATALTYLGLKREESTFAYPSELPHYTVYQCADGRYIAMAPLEMPFWNMFCENVGMPDWIDKVVEPKDEKVQERIRTMMATKPLHEWVEIFDRKPCCVSPVNTIDEALQTVAAQERHLLTYMVHPTLGSIPQLASPMLNQQERRHMCKPVATMDNAAVKALKDLGYSVKEIKRLCSENIVDLRHASDPSETG
jgi:crotonobetainyl-CoA:carnitine CoA-transferase CaiB-like acyl-CoA transferase